MWFRFEVLDEVLDLVCYVLFTEWSLNLSVKWFG